MHGMRLRNRFSSTLTLAPLALMFVLLAGCETVMPSDKSPLRGSMLSHASVTEATQRLLAGKESTVAAELPSEEVMISAINSATRAHGSSAKKAPEGSGAPPPAPWTIYGHDWFAVFDEKSQDWIHFWQNNNPNKPPDSPDWQCWGYVWHWAYDKELHAWQIGTACADAGTPGAGSYSFTAH